MPTVDLPQLHLKKINNNIYIVGFIQWYTHHFFYLKNDSFCLLSWGEGHTIWLLQSVLYIHLLTGNFMSQINYKTLNKVN